MKKFIQITYSLLIVLSLAGLAYLSKDMGKPKLFYENRTKAPMPVLKEDSLFSGQFFPQLESHLSDKFYKREDLLYLQTRLDKDILHRPIVNDLYIRQDTILPTLELEFPQDLGKEGAKMAQDYKKLSDQLEARGAKFIYLGIPGHVSIYMDQYPQFAQKYQGHIKDMEEYFFQELNKNQVTNIRASAFLEKDAHYNATDHHYNYLGAIRTYHEIIKTINQFQPQGQQLNRHGIQLEELTKPFKGSYAKKLFYDDGFHDKGWIYNPDFTLRDKGPEETKNTLFPFDLQERKDHIDYGIYMGGDQAVQSLHTDREGLPVVLIYGDSYTNPLETLLIRNLKSLYSLDFRYYKDGSLTQAVEEFKPDYVICVRDDLNYLRREGNGVLK